MQAANTELIDKYLSGELSKEDEADDAAAAESADGVVLEPEQRRNHETGEMVAGGRRTARPGMACVRARPGARPAWEQVLGTDHAFALEGPAGSGKSTVVEHAVWHMRCATLAHAVSATT